MFIDNGFGRAYSLCFSHGNHYDVIYPAATMRALELCQSIVYDIVGSTTGLPQPSAGGVEPYKNLEMNWWRTSLAQQQNADLTVARALQTGSLFLIGESIFSKTYLSAAQKPANESKKGNHWQTVGQKKTGRTKSVPTTAPHQPTDNPEAEALMVI